MSESFNTDFQLAVIDALGERSVPLKVASVLQAGANQFCLPLAFICYFP